MFCGNCGKMLVDGALFCDVCGSKVIADNAETAAQVYEGAPYNDRNIKMKAGAAKKEKKSVKKAFKLVAVIAAVTILGGGGTYAFIRFGGYGRQAETVLSENDKALEKLLPLIEQAEECIDNYDDKIAEFDATEYGSDEAVEKFSDYAEATDECLSEILEIREQADEITGLDDNIKSAKDFYFNTICDSRMSLYETYDFFSRYFELYEGNIENMPEFDGYDSWSDYYMAFYDWYLNTKEAYDTIGEVPNCLEAEWKRYGDVLDMAEYACYKYEKAVYNNDFLTLQSAKNIDGRYFKSKFDENGEVTFECIELKVFNIICEHMGGEVRLAGVQEGCARELAAEIKEYADLDEDAKKEFEFEYDYTGKIWLAEENFEAVDTIYPALYNSYDSFVTIKTGALSGVRTIVVEAEIPGFTQLYKETIDIDSAYTEIPIKPAVLSGDIDLSVAKSAQINVSIYEKDGSTLIEAKSFPVTIKSVNDVEWVNDDFLTSTKDNILCFLTPEADAIDTLKSTAVDEISYISAGQIQSLPGYQETGFGLYVGTYLQVAALMRAMYDMGVRYSMDTFSSSGSQQHVKLPEEVINKKSGLCIETSLVIASALQSMGMHAMIVMPTGHAQVAVEVWNNGEGAGEYFLIETTCLSDDWNNNAIVVKYAEYMVENGVDGINPEYLPVAYLDASQWNAYITSDPNMYIIDCDDSRILGLTPFAN